MPNPSLTKKLVELIHFSGGGGDPPASCVDFLNKYPEMELNEKCPQTGKTPLIAALAGCKKNLAEILLNSGADVNFCDSSGESPLFHAGEETIHLILARNPKIDHQDFEGQSALFTVAPSFIALLIKRNANINLRDFKDRTALDFRIERLEDFEAAALFFYHLMDKELKCPNKILSQYEHKIKPECFADYMRQEIFKSLPIGSAPLDLFYELDILSASYIHGKPLSKYLLKQTNPMFVQLLRDMTNRFEYLKQGPVYNEWIQSKEQAVQNAQASQGQESVIERMQKQIDALEARIGELEKIIEKLSPVESNSTAKSAFTRRL